MGGVTVIGLERNSAALTARVRGVLDRLADDAAARGVPDREDIARLPVHVHPRSGWTVAVASPTLSPSLHLSQRVASLPEDQLAGILAHEVGHLCDVSERRFGRADVAVRLVLFLSPALPVGLGAGPGAAVAIAALQLTRQRREYAADAFAHRLGHGAGLQAFLTAFAAATGQSLARKSVRDETHPSAGDRIRRLDGLG